MVDAADNNVFLLNGNNLLAGNPSTNNGGAVPGAACPYPQDTGYVQQGISAYANCSEYAVPGQVVGLLPGGVHCFIATAAFGSPIEPVVKTLRQFRDQFLLPYHWGRQFVRFYYKHSPYYAVYVQDFPIIKHLTQAALIPVWGLAWLMLNYGAFATVLILLGITTLIIFEIRESRR